MELINAALAQRNLQFSQLPKHLQGEIQNFQDYINKYNEACDVYESKDEEDPEMVKQLDESENYIIETDTALAEQIKNFNPAPAPKTAEEEEAERQAAAAAAAAEKDKSKKKGGSAVLWVIGGVVLTAITLGAVNGFKRGE